MSWRVVTVLLVAVFLAALIGCDYEETSHDGPPEPDGSEDVADDDDEQTYAEPWNEAYSTPHVAIHSHRPGQILDASSAQISGNVTGDVSSVAVDGQAVSLENGAFEQVVAFESGNALREVYVSALDENYRIGAERIALYSGKAMPVDQAIPETLAISVAHLGLDFLEPLLDGLIEGINLDLPLGGITISQGIGGFDVTDGNWTLDFEGNAVATDPIDAQWERFSLGSEGQRPALDGTVPATGDPYDFALTINDDFVNRLLFAVVDAGLLNADLDVKAGDLAGIFSSLSKVDPDMPGTLSLYAEAPPVVTFGANGLWLHLPDYRLQLKLNPQDHAPWTAFVASIHLTLALDLQADGLNGVSIDLLQDDIHLVFTDNAIQESSPTLELVEMLVGDIVFPVLDLVAGLLTIPPIEIGESALVPVWLGADGATSDFLSIYFIIE